MFKKFTTIGIRMGSLVSTLGSVYRVHRFFFNSLLRYFVFSTFRDLLCTVLAFVVEFFMFSFIKFKCKPPMKGLIQYRYLLFELPYVSICEMILRSIYL